MNDDFARAGLRLAEIADRVLAELPADGRHVPAADVVRAVVGDGVSTATAWAALGGLCAERRAEVRDSWARRLPRDGRA